MPDPVALPCAPNACERAEPGRRDVEPHPEHAEVVDRIVAGPSRANGVLEFVRVHAGAVIENGDMRVSRHAGRERDMDLGITDRAALTVRGDKPVNRVVHEFPDALPLFKVDLAEHREDARVRLEVKLPAGFGATIRHESSPLRAALSVAARE